MDVELAAPSVTASLPALPSPEDSPKTTPEASPSSSSDGAGAAKKKYELSDLFCAHGMPVSFQSLSYSVRHSRHRGQIARLLDDVNGFLLPGEMSALMGPSGSGKTTLLDVLAGRKTVGKVEGRVLFSGQRATPAFLQRFTGYVEQQDTLIGMMTPTEMFMYTAELKRGRSVSCEQKKLAVEEIISVLALQSCRDVLIGNELTRGISGGQAKRVNIGIALIGAPHVLFLDEPTSGLDSYTANEVMTVVKGLSQAGITVVATVHSPTPYCFGLFDRLLLLLRGRLAYFGPGGTRAVDYFISTVPDVRSMGMDENEAEWITDLTVKADRHGRSEELAELYRASPVWVAASAELEELSDRPADPTDRQLTALGARNGTAVSSVKATWIMLRFRATKNYMDLDRMIPRVGSNILFSFVVFSLFWKIGNKFDPINLYNIFCVLFMWVVLPAYASVGYLPSLVMDRPLFNRERADGLYKPHAYLAYRMFEELGITVPISLGCAAWVFYTVQFQGSFALFWIGYMVTNVIGIVLGYFVAAASPNMATANSVLFTGITILTFFVGFMLRTADMPNYWRWFNYICFLRYPWGALMKNQFNGDRNVAWIQGGTVLSNFGLDGISAWGWIGIECGFAVFFLTCTLLCMTYIKWQKR